MKITPFQCILGLVLSISLASSFFSCNQGSEKRKQSSKMETILSGLSNADVKWEGTYRGLSPVLNNQKARDLLEKDEQIDAELIAEISNEETFVLAHVILTLKSSLEFQTFPEWNGLYVEILEDGAILINPKQRFGLKKQWEKWYRMDPRPNILPLE